MRLLMALVMVMVCRVLDIPVGVSGQAAMARAVRVQRARAARRGDLGLPRLTKARAWHAKSTVSSMASLFNSIYEDAIFVAREDSLMINLVTTYSAQGNASRILPIYPTLSASEVAEGVDYANPIEWTKAGQMTLTPAEVMTQVILTDARINTDPDDARRDAAIEMGGAIATKIDADLAALMGSFTTDKGASGSALTLKRCAAGLAVLRNSKVKPPFFFVLHPYGWFDIWVELGQPAATNAFLGETANQAMRDYAVMSMLGAQWFTSANAATSGSDATSGVFNRQALAYDVREAPTMEPERDASLRAWELNMRATYAKGVRRADHGIELTHDATEPAG
jgi:hypothetical protein